MGDVGNPKISFLPQSEGSPEHTYRDRKREPGAVALTYYRIIYTHGWNDGFKAGAACVGIVAVLLGLFLWLAFGG